MDRAGLASEQPAGAECRAARRKSENAEGKDLMRLGLGDSRDPEAALWREQARDFGGLRRSAPSLDQLPRATQLMNLAPMEFDDADSARVRWVFSHDTMRFEGYAWPIARRRARSASTATQPFPAPPLPVRTTSCFDRTRGLPVRRGAGLRAAARAPAEGRTLVGLRPGRRRHRAAQRPRAVLLRRARPGERRRRARAAPARADARPRRRPAAHRRDGTARRLAGLLQLHALVLQRRRRRAVPGDRCASTTTARVADRRASRRCCATTASVALPELVSRRRVLYSGAEGRRRPRSPATWRRCRWTRRRCRARCRCSRACCCLLSALGAAWRTRQDRLSHGRAHRLDRRLRVLGVPALLACGCCIRSAKRWTSRRRSPRNPRSPDART